MKVFDQNRAKPVTQCSIFAQSVILAHNYDATTVTCYDTGDTSMCLYEDQT